MNFIHVSLVVSMVTAVVWGDGPLDECGQCVWQRATLTAAIDQHLMALYGQVGQVSSFKVALISLIDDNEVLKHNVKQNIEDNGIAEDGEKIDA